MAERLTGEGFEQYWQVIQFGIDKVVSFYADGLPLYRYPVGPLTMAEYSIMYTMVYQVSIGRQDYGPEVYNRYKTFCQEYLSTKVLEPVKSKTGESMLREAVKGWRRYKNVTRLISRLFSYLDEYYTKRRGYLSLPDFALRILQEQFYDVMSGPIIHAVSKLIQEDRDGNPSDLSLVKEVLETVYDLQSQTSKISYQIDFEREFIDSSSAYYLMKFEHWSRTLYSNEYASKVMECVNAEKSRAEQFLHPSTISKLAEAIVPDIKNPYWSTVISLGRRVEQLERAAANNLVHAMDELTINDADTSGKPTGDENCCLAATSETPKDGGDIDDRPQQVASDEIMEDDEYVIV